MTSGENNLSRLGICICGGLFVIAVSTLLNNRHFVDIIIDFVDTLFTCLPYCKGRDRVIFIYLSQLSCLFWPTVGDFKLFN